MSLHPSLFSSDINCGLSSSSITANDTIGPVLNQITDINKQLIITNGRYSVGSMWKGRLRTQLVCLGELSVLPNNRII